MQRRLDHLAPRPFSGWSLLTFLIAVPVFLAACAGGTRQEADRSYRQIVILSDTHLPGNILAAKEKAVQTINSWMDVDMVVVTGDVVATGGSEQEFDLAMQFLSRVSKPLRVIGGNHDYIYPDSYPKNPATGHTLKEASPEARSQKLERFKAKWGQPEIFHSERMGAYLLVFLTPDDLISSNYTQMSDRQLSWLDAELGRNRDLPTIVFFHGPLEGTYATRRIVEATTPDSYNAEPARKIKEILHRNRQVFLWVAGHLHLAPSNPSFNSPINLYDSHVRVIHNPDLNGDSIFSDTDMKKRPKHDSIWTNSLFLYRDRVVVKTYDHRKEIWLDGLDRTIEAPKPLG